MKVYGHQHSSEVFSRETSPSCFEPKAEKVIAFHGKDASYAYKGSVPAEGEMTP